jgi:hypothetical protein
VCPAEVRCRSQNGPHARDIAEDATLRKEFIDDMEKAMKIGARILGITKAA